MTPHKQSAFNTLLIGTVLLTRIFVFLVPDVTLRALGITIHHFVFGIMLVLLGIVATNARTIALPIGLGLIADQLIFMLLGGGGDVEYWSSPSVIGAALSTIAIIATSRMHKNLLR